MARLFGGLTVIGAGLFLVVVSFYYAWASGTPNFSTQGYEQYQLYSMVFGVLSVGVMAFGVYMVVSAIKRMNRTYKDEQALENAKRSGQDSGRA
jgi:membrane-bound ClpP family serine protease